mgnify:CR=1 FL=1
MPYSLEVLKFLVNKEGEEGWMKYAAKLKHMGYMDVCFRTKEEACSYYDRHNPHMRKLNAHGTFKSDWDPNTHLLYIVREYYGIVKTIPPFDPNDAIVVVRTKNSVSKCIYKPED